jgi:beta-phosphoglucomutase-like phosphatase (HAD superfamily)
VVSSSPRTLIDRLLRQLGVLDVIGVRIGADDVHRPKPDPEGFLRAAERLGVAPAECVVFEDSSAGLAAARAAGMASVLILTRCDEPERCRALATTAIVDYTAIASDGWGRLCAAGPRALEAKP